jgi:hypothetical protein
MQNPMRPRPSSDLFVPHGQVAFSSEGQRLFGSAEGPFNVELAQEVQWRVTEWCRRLHAQGPFDHCCEFRGSALATPDALLQLSRMLQALVAEGITPAHTAYVFPPDLEGGSLIAPMFVRAFVAVGMPMRLFASRAEALRWLDEQAR